MVIFSPVMIYMQSPKNHLKITLTISILTILIISVLLKIVRIAIQRTKTQLMIINVVNNDNNNKSNNEINVAILEVNIYKTLKRKVK